MSDAADWKAPALKLSALILGGIFLCGVFWAGMRYERSVRDASIAEANTQAVERNADANIEAVSKEAEEAIKRSRHFIKSEVQIEEDKNEDMDMPCPDYCQHDYNGLREYYSPAD